VALSAILGICVENFSSGQWAVDFHTLLTTCLPDHQGAVLITSVRSSASRPLAVDFLFS
jgi:hypothetical protein